LENQLKRFHFREIDWTVSFPSCGNSGEYRNYKVTFRKGKSQTEKPVKLKEVLETPEFESQYPHTVGYYKSSSDEATNLKPDYLELKKICTVEEFWFLLSQLNL
jgi:hypothetical protein